jgi:hypothetical protein
MVKRNESSSLVSQAAERMRISVWEGQMYALAYAKKGKNSSLPEFSGSFQ